MGREGKTFDMVGKVVGKHLVQYLRHAFNNGRLEDTAGVSPDTGLKGANEDDGLYV